MSKLRKLGTNRGNPRVWLERKVLSNYGWRKGQRFDVHTSVGLNHEILLSSDRHCKLAHEPPSRYRVSGSDDRPVIDLNGAWLKSFFKDATHYTADVREDLITIKAVRGNA